MGCLRLKNIKNQSLLRTLNGENALELKTDVRKYRYGFNGMEKDDEVKGQGSSYTTPLRQLDIRIGRWLITDPIVHHHQSPYSSFNNNPLKYIDPSGGKGEDWVKGGLKEDGTVAGVNTWHWVERITSPAEASEAGYSDYRKPGSEIFGSLNGSERNAPIMLGDRKAKYKYIEEATVNANSKQKKKPEDLQSIATNLAASPLPSQGYQISDPLALKNAWGQDSKDFAKIIHTGLMIVGGGMLFSEAYIVYQSFAPLVNPWIVNTAKGYHNTFGKNGGYVNMGIDLGLQKLSNPNNSINIYSTIGSGFIPGNNWRKIAAFEISTTMIKVQSNSIDISLPNYNNSGNLIFNTITDSYGRSKYGTPFMGLYYKSTGAYIQGKIKKD